MYKKYFIKGLVFAIVLTFFTACSSDVNDGTSSSDIGSITDTQKINYIAVKEGTQNVITLLTNSSLVLSGEDAYKFTVSGSSLLFKSAPDYERDKKRYYVTLNGEKFVITLIDVNDNAPIFEDTNISVRENTTSVVELDAIDADFNSTITYSIEESAEGGPFFDIDDNQVFFKEAPDYEKKSRYTFTAIADDGIHITQQLMVVNIEDVPDVIPELANLSLIVSEDTESNITIGNIDIIEVGDTNISKMALSGDGNDTFHISLDGNISITAGKKLNYDNNGGIQSYHFTLVATNEAGDSNVSDVNISVKNVIDEVPVLIKLETSIKENAPKDTQIGPINRIYEGDSPISAINLIGEHSNLFTVDTHGFIYLKESNSLDYETQPQYNFKAVAKNTAGDSAEVDVNISVEDYINKPFQISKIVTSNREENSAFGSSVAMNDDYIIVGAYNEDTEYRDAGVAYIYKKFPSGDFTKVSKIEASDANNGDNFAKSVAIAGDYMVVGAPNNDDGMAYLFQRVSDEKVDELAKIIASDASKGDMFGSSIAMTTRYIVISSPQADIKKDDTTYANAGAVYIYTINSNSEVVNEVKISAKSPKQDDHFGTSVAICGNYIVVSAPNKDSLDDNDIGYVYLFKIESDGVIQKGAFKADDATAYSYFGSSISIDDSYILVGADGDDSIKTDGGTAYLFKRGSSDSNITQIAKFQADDIKKNDAFGKTVSIDGNYMVVGDLTGSIYTFKKESTQDNNITQIMKNEAFDAETDDGFGTSLAINGDYIVVGAYKENSKASNNQSVYLFYMEPISKPYIYNEIDYISYDEPFIQHDLIAFQADTPNGGTIELNIEGEDNGALLFSGNNLRFNEKANYEEPKDSDGDNKYKITIVAQDQNNQSTNFDLKIDVNNREYLDVATLSPSDIQNNNKFANSIAISGDYIVVSSYKKERVYLYKKDSSSKLRLLTSFQAEDTEERNEDGTNFGISLSIDGEYIVVGANTKDKSDVEKDVGSVYLFKIENDEVSQIAKIVADDSAKNDNFGTVVSLSGDYIAVGVPNIETAYLFKRESDDDNNVTQVAKFMAKDSAENDFFGEAIAINGNYVLVGAPNEDTTEDNAGSSYLFKIADDDIKQIAKIQIENPEENDYFGDAVSIDGDYFVIGAVGKESYKGKAYLFKRKSDSENDIEQMETLTAQNAIVDDGFGASVSINNNIIVIGATGTEKDAGNIYIFEKKSNDNTISIEKLKIENAQNGDNFGKSVDIDGDFIVAGAPGKENNSGKGYIFIKDKE